MLAPVYCQGCGQRVEVPDGYTRLKLRCPDCGVFTELPKEVRDAAQSAAKAAEPADEDFPGFHEPEPTPQPPPVARMAPPAVDEDAGVYGFKDEPAPRAKSEPKPKADDEEREVLIRGTDEDDGKPYSVKGDAATKACPECGRRVARRAGVCIHCGFDFGSGKKADRSYEPIDRAWENGWPLNQRIMAFVALQVLNFLALMASVVAGKGEGVAFTTVLLSVGLQAFLVGTFDRLNLARTPKGKVTLTRAWRYAFLPRLPEPVRWREHESVAIVQSNDFDPIDWAICFILIGYLCVPGIVYFWYVIRPDKFTVFLCKDHGSAETPLFRTRNQNQAKEIQAAVIEATGLPARV